MFQLTDKADSASRAVQKQPNIVLAIDGISDKFGSAVILELIRVGDPGLLVGGGWVIGGSRPILGQVSAVSFDSSGTSIKQQLDIDKGRGQGISSMEIGLVDVNQRITRIISPGIEVDDILGRKASVFISPDASTTDFPIDYTRIFRGIIDSVDAGPGLIKINIAHPDQKKRQQIYLQRKAKTIGSHTNSDTTINVDSTVGFLTKVLGPDGTYDASFGSYIRVNDEIIQYTGVTPTSFTGCTRNQFSTTATAHAADSEVSSVYMLTGNAMDLALKVMLSTGGNSDATTLTHFNRNGDNSLLPNGIFFRKKDVQDEFGVTVGSYVTTSGAANGANNVTNKQVTEITVSDSGDSYIIIDGVSFVDEFDSTALIEFRSQFDTLPDGLGMGADEVDINQHLKLKTLFLSGFSYEFRLTESLENGKEWLEQEIYKPCGAYSIPRNAQSSASYFIGPIPNGNIKTLSTENIIKPSQLKVQRSINTNFANTIIYKYDKNAITGKFQRAVVYQSATSLTQIPVGVRGQVIESSGIRQTLDGANITLAAANRKLKRFRFGSETIPNVQVTFGEGFNIELADVLILDATGLQLVNTVDGNRDKPAKLFEVNNISKDAKTGKVTINLLDTNFDGAKRYGLIGPSSQIRSGTTSSVTIEASVNFSQPFGSAEYKKWNRYQFPVVTIRSVDSSTRYGQAVLQGNAGNSFSLSPSLGFTPQLGDIMELSHYDYPETDQILLVYIFMSDSVFPDGGLQYSML